MVAKMKIKLTNVNARVPLRKHPTDAGADLFSPQYLSILPHMKGFIDFGIAIELPKGTMGLIFARSGLGGEGLRPKNCVGVIDENYRGNLGMMVENASPKVKVIDLHDRIAQLVIVPILTPEFEVVSHLDDTDRGVGGFGHTGKGD